MARYQAEVTLTHTFKVEVEVGSRKDPLAEIDAADLDAKNQAVHYLRWWALNEEHDFILDDMTVFLMETSKEGDY